MRERERERGNPGAADADRGRSRPRHVLPTASDPRAACSLARSPPSGYPSPRADPERTTSQIPITQSRAPIREIDDASSVITCAAYTLEVGRAVSAARSRASPCRAGAASLHDRGIARGEGGRRRRRRKRHGARITRARVTPVAARRGYEGERQRAATRSLRRRRSNWASAGDERASLPTTPAERLRRRRWRRPPLSAGRAARSCSASLVLRAHRRTAFEKQSRRAAAAAPRPTSPCARALSPTSSRLKMLSPRGAARLLLAAV